MTSTEAVHDESVAATAGPAQLGDIAAVVRGAASVLRAAGVPSPDVDAELLLAHTLTLSRGQVQAAMISGYALAQRDLSAYAESVRRRCEREPLQHITGTAAFRYIELAVGPGVFVPRPETEMLVDVALERLPHGGTAIDLGTGSGAIALSLGHERPDATVSAIEASPTAFTWAERNRRALGLENVTIVHGDFTDAAILQVLPRHVDVVVSNPPYVPSTAIPRDPEVWLFDPDMALYSGIDGLDAIRSIAVNARHLVRAGGALVIEHGEYQGQAVRDIFDAAGWADATTNLDLTGRDRVTSATR